MFRDRAVARVKQHLTFRTDKTDEIIEYLQEVQNELEHDPVLPWFLKEELSMATVTPGEQRIPLPQDFLREHEDSALYRYDPTGEVDDQWVELKKDSVDFLRLKYQSTQGPPLAYYTDKDYFRMFPTPDAEYILKMIYYKRGDPLTENIENVWLFHSPELLIGMAGQRIALDLRDGDALNAFRVMEADARRRLVTGSEAREHVNRRYVMGGPD